MPSFRSTVLAAAVTFAAVAQADYTIDPNTVPLGTRKVWCQNEKTTCPLICQQMEPRTTIINDCDPASLTYSCECGNKQQPNLTEYTLSLPYFICQEWGNQCVKNCNNDNTCQSDCREKHPCGAQDPKRENKTTSTATASASASKTDGPNTIYTDSPGGSSSGGSGSGGSSGSGSSDKKGAAAALDVGRTYGLAVVMSGLFAGFALL